MKATADRLDEKNHDTKMSKMLQNATITKKLHKGELQHQMLNKKLTEKRMQDRQDKIDNIYNRQIEEDDTLMAIYPKIKGIPEQRLKAHYRSELGKIYTVNKDANDTRVELSKLTNQNENAQQNAHNERAAREF